MRHSAEGSTLGSHEYAEHKHKFSLLAVQRVHCVWIPHHLFPSKALVKILKSAKRGGALFLAMAEDG